MTTNKPPIMASRFSITRSIKDGGGGAERTTRVVSRTTGAVVTSGSSSTTVRSEEHTSELQSRGQLVCRLLLEKKKQWQTYSTQGGPMGKDEVTARQGPCHKR